MSTKNEIYSNKKYFIYEDCFEEDKIFLEIENLKNFSFFINNLNSKATLCFNKNDFEILCKKYLSYKKQKTGVKK